MSAHQSITSMVEVVNSELQKHGFIYIHISYILYMESQESLSVDSDQH